MIAVLALLLAAAPEPSPQLRFDECVKESDRNPAGAEQVAVRWAANGGGVLAAQCLGLARSAQGRWADAADAFSAGARLAEQTHDGRAATLWASAGNALLAGGHAAAAKTALDSALALPSLEGPLRGEALLDRARADVALGQLPPARIDIDAALKLIDRDPMAWLLSATLARRMGEPVRAGADIRQAELLAPNEADILYEAGNIAAASGHIDQARAQWARARAADPSSEAAQAAARELEDSGEPAAKPAAAGGR